MLLIKGQKKKLCYLYRGILERQTGYNYSWIVTQPYHYSFANKLITVPKGFVCNGATWAPDIESDSWLIHDWLYCHQKFDDDYPCSRHIADFIMIEILKEEGGIPRSMYRWAFSVLVKINPFKVFDKAWGEGKKSGTEILIKE